MRTHSILPAILMLSLLPSCASRVGDFSTLSNRNVQVGGDHGAPVVGRDCTWRLFAIPLAEISLEDAVDNAMAREPRAEYLTDVTVRRTGWWFGKTCYEVRGTPTWHERSGVAETAAPMPAPAPAATAFSASAGEP